MDVILQSIQGEQICFEFAPIEHLPLAESVYILESIDVYSLDTANV